jgi:uncharacterized membrane protein
MNMRRVRRFWLALTFVATSFATAAVLYRRLPAIIPVHWSASGVADGWAPKWEGAFLLPCLPSAIVLGLILSEPWLMNDPWTPGSRMKAHFYPTLVAAVAAIGLYIHSLVLLAGLRRSPGLPTDVATALGLVIAVLGASLRRDSPPHSRDSPGSKR